MEPEWQKRMDRAEAQSNARYAKAEARMDRFDRQLIAMRDDLVRRGTKLFLEIGELQREVRAELKELARSQRKTDRMLKTLLASMGKGHNGHKRA